jgi:predicted metal-binding protein
VAREALRTGLRRAVTTSRVRCMFGCNHADAIAFTLAESIRR